MRKQALRLAELRTKRTHSSQTYTSFTDKTHEDESQIVSVSRTPKADEETQTTATRGVGTSSAPVGSKSYIIGLRGETSFPVEHIVLNDLITSARGTTYASVSYTHLTLPTNREV